MDTNEGTVGRRYLLVGEHKLMQERTVIKKADWEKFWMAWGASMEEYHQENWFKIPRAEILGETWMMMITLTGTTHAHTHTHTFILKNTNVWCQISLVYSNCVLEHDMLFGVHEYQLITHGIMLAQKGLTFSITRAEIVNCINNSQICITYCLQFLDTAVCRHIWHKLQQHCHRGSGQAVKYWLWCTGHSNLSGAFSKWLHWSLARTRCIERP